MEFFKSFLVSFGSAESTPPAKVGFSGLSFAPDYDGNEWFPPAALGIVLASGVLIKIAEQTILSQKKVPCAGGLPYLLGQLWVQVWWQVLLAPSLIAMAIYQHAETLGNSASWFDLTWQETGGDEWKPERLFLYCLMAYFLKDLYKETDPLQIAHHVCCSIAAVAVLGYVILTEE